MKIETSIGKITASEETLKELFMLIYKLQMMEDDKYGYDPERQSCIVSGELYDKIYYKY